MARARISDIATLASRLSGVSMADIKGRSRFRRIVLVRCGIITVARQNGHSFPEIGRVMERDHSSIINSFYNAPGYIRVYPEVGEFIKQLGEMAQTSTPFLDGIKWDFVVPPPAKPKVVKPRPKPKNDFGAGKYEPDDSHHFHMNIAAGSTKLLAAIQQARAA